MKNSLHAESPYLSQPALFEKNLYFVADDDIWKVSVTGGSATRLTHNQGVCTSPFISPDGENLVFMSNWKGQDDLFMMPSHGGAAKRLTFKANAKALRWTSDKTLLVASTHESPFRTAYAYELNIENLNLKPMNLGYLTHYDFSKSGMAVLARNGGDPARWKRYRGGTAGQIWTRASAKEKWTRILSDIPSNLTDPCLVGDRVYFLSDHEGIGNVYSCEIDGSKVKSHTDQKEYYCRSLYKWNEQLVYQSGAEIFHLNLKKNESKKIAIDVASSFTQAQPSVREATHYADNAALSSDGSKILTIARGHLFSSPSFGGTGLHHSNTDEKRYSMARFIEGDKKLIAVQNQLFSDSLVIGEVDQTTVKELSAAKDLGKVWSIRVSPNDSDVAITNNRGELFILNLKSLKMKKVFKADSGRVYDTSWSPCSRYLAFSAALNDRVEGMFIYDHQKNQTRPLVTPILNDYSPSFDPTGKYLYFLSAREFHPTYSETHFSLSFPVAAGVYAICLNQVDKNPFESWSPIQKPEVATKKKDKQKPAPIKTQIDFEGIENRIYRAPLELGGYWKVMAVKGGFVFGQGGLQKHDPDQAMDWKQKADISFFSLEDKKSVLLQKKADQLMVSKNLEKILVRSADKYRVISSTTPPAENKGVEHKDGWIDLSRFRFQIQPQLEWRQIYNEAWFLQKEHFWTRDMSKVKWDLIYKRYLKLLPKVKTRKDFSDLLWEMQGELGTSHCYEYGGDYQRRGTSQFPGYLGAELTFLPTKKAMQIDKIYKGDSWITALRSPLTEAGVGLNVGDLILDVDGVSFDSAEKFYGIMTHKSRVNCNILAQRKGSAKKERLELKTLASEKPVIYRDWVEKNRDYVHKKTKGKVGYVHVPNMMVKGYSEFYRGYLKESSYDALIVDVRYNGGGHVSQHLLTQLSQKVNAFVVTRHQKHYTNPNYAVRGPIVAITNEFAGSDGDIFSHNFKQMKIGPLIGVRTWGGVVGINGQYTLKDGTQTTQPEYSYYFRDVGFKVENYGTDPDIEVVPTPEGLGKNIDEQLDRAIEETLDLLQKTPAFQPEFSDYPNLSLPT